MFALRVPWLLHWDAPFTSVSAPAAAAAAAAAPVSGAAAGPG